MKTTLVGFTGFVGGNLRASHDFDGLYNSKNISNSFGADNGLVVYCGVRAEKFLANSDPAADRALIDTAIDNIERMAPARLVLISTADVYKDPRGVDENTEIVTDGLHPYGLDRYDLERWVRRNCRDAVIIRLPGLYGAGLKKNFIYDMITLVPSMLKAEKYEQLAAQSGLVRDGYSLAPNGFYKLCADGGKRAALREFFASNDFNSLCFTDSRASYQFYGLSNLWNDINRALSQDVPLVNLTSEPISAAELYRFVRGGEFTNELRGEPVSYDLRSVYAERFGGENGYMYSKRQVMDEIKRGVETGTFVKQ